MSADLKNREYLFNTMVIRQNIVSLTGEILVSDVPGILQHKASSLIANKERYAAIARRFVNPGLKWWFPAVIHEMECSQNFNCYLGNGQLLNRITTIAPSGRGPFASFEDGAVDALKLQRADSITDWSIGNVLYFLEGYNGYGYANIHKMNSPYLWSGSNQYIAGKYVVDGKFDANAVSQQIGVALLLKKIMYL